MKLNFVFFIFLMFILLTIHSCIRDDNPLSIEKKIIPHGSCETEGIYIDFADTCSYDFVILFLSEYDSVKIQKTYLGVDLFLYADSGNANYWFDYYKADSLNFSLSSYAPSDSLILVFEFISEEKFYSEKDDLINHRNLHFKKFVFHNKSVMVQVPEKTEQTWVNFFDQFDFIEYVYWIIICSE